MIKPFVLSIIGKSDSGKTTLILKLLPELKKKREKDSNSQALSMRF